MSGDGGVHGFVSLKGRICRKCGAEYAHSACRDSECPMRPGSAPERAAAEVDPARRAHVIVLGNAKGGSGKSTIAMHLMVALAKGGLSVGSIDLDGTQGTLSRYVENRRAYGERSGAPLDLPEHRRILPSDAAVRSAAEREDAAQLKSALRDLADKDVVVIDTPGSDGFLSRLGHGCADTLITPMNDSFLDLDVLARVDGEGRKIAELSAYSRMIVEHAEARARAGRPPLDWVVMRNRLSHIDARNKRDVGRLLEQLAERAQFRLASGFGERVIFRELFLKGLSLLDLRDEGAAVGLTMSHLAARQEMRALLQEIAVPTEPAPAPEKAERKQDGAAPTARGAQHAWLGRLPGHVRRAVLRTTMRT
jgi:chromosome partitioning protein